MPILEVFNCRNNRLGHRLVFLMVLSSSLLSVIATCVQLYSSYQRDKHQLVTETFDIIEQSFRYSLENALWEFNFQQVEAVLDGIHAKASVQDIELMSVTGHTWRRGENAVADDPVSRSFELTKRGSDKASEPLGTLKVDLTLQDVRDRIWAQFWTLFFSNLGKTFLASLIMLALFHGLVTRHLRDTARFVNGTDWMEGHKPLQLERRETSDDLEKIVNAINGAKTRVLQDVDRLKQTNAELIRSNSELDDFAHIASHDLKEPLRAICNHASFLLEDYEERLDEDGKNRLRRLIKLSQRMEQLIADLLFYSRLGRSEQAIEMVNVADVLKKLSLNHSELLEERNAQLSYIEPFPAIIGRRAHVETVFRHLIMNGINYNDADEKLIEVGFSTSTQNSEQGNAGIFYVKDNGIGIDQKFEDEAFRIFKRLKSEKAYGEGTGAGLTFAKKIVENHNGRIWFTSTIGEGTTFFFTLPIADAESMRIAGQQAA